MSFQVSIFDNFLVDLSAGTLGSSTVVDALLLKSTYVYDRTETDVSDFTTELSGGSYSRFASSAVFTIAQVADEVQYQNLTPQVSFGSFSASDWQYIILFNHTTLKPYLCVDTGVVNTQVSSGFTLEPGTDPYVRLVSP